MTGCTLYPVKIELALLYCGMYKKSSTSLFVVVLCALQCVQSEEYYWIGFPGGPWGTASNWNSSVGEGIPGQNDDG